MRDRGHRNTNERGNAAQRRARRQWLLDHYGDGQTAPCSDCGHPVDDSTIYVDRIVPAHLGGTYQRGNIQPHCQLCSCRQGQRIRRQLKELAALIERTVVCKSAS